MRVELLVLFDNQVRGENGASTTLHATALPEIFYCPAFGFYSPVLVS